MDKLSVYCIYIYEMMECIECNEIKIIHFETRLNLMRIPITRVVDLFSKINWKIRCFSLLFSFYLFRLISFEYELSSIIRNISFHEKKSESLFQNFLISTTNMYIYYITYRNSLENLFLKTREIVARINNENVQTLCNY